MNNNTRKVLIVLITVALLLLTVAGTTLAYLLDHTDTLKNIFTPGQISCSVVENGQEYTSNVVNVSEKSNVTVKNTGTVSAYIRAAVLVTWKSEGGVVYAATPATGDYTLQIGTGDWTEKDGFYYYKTAVAPGSVTSQLITSAKQLNQSPVGSDGTRYYLSVEIVAEAIQAEGMGAGTAQDAWTIAQTAKEGQ